MPARPHRLLAVGVSTALLATGLAAVAAPAGAATPRTGHMIPASLYSQHTLVGRSVAPNTTFTCQTTTPAGCYGPDQIRAAYGIDQLPQDGAGTTIAIIDAYQSPTIKQDLTKFDSLFGLPAANFQILAPNGKTPFNQNDQTQTGWAGEISLDVEWAHAVAPKAAIRLVLAKTSSDKDILHALQYVVNSNDFDVLSQSYGEAEQCQDPAITTAAHKLYAKARTNGMTVFASSGDQGAAQPTCDGSSFFKAVSTPATDPNVTSVGGTTLDANGTTGAYNGEVAWNEPQYQAAGGGGYSTLYPVPSYQTKAVGSSATGRAVPDVSYNAAIGAGVLTVWSTSGQGANLVFSFGGTSSGSPQWAGLAALTDQAAMHRVGFVSSKLYTLANATRSYAADYHDVLTGDNTYHGASVTVTGYSAGAKWDAATGLGSPKANKLIPALAG